MDVTICKFCRISAQRRPLAHPWHGWTARAVCQRLRGAGTIQDL